ncbi:hypothetical protein GCM10023340_05610 [Nocardioides marinquilinus]|uniref:HTH marR-type domain-containing protein n=1 Tax=Nocardioides marinquilinus TaxID=1210400 RepID=A0ABP9PBD6_9ACTN
MARLENLLGVLSLAVADAMHDHDAGAGLSRSEQAVLVSVLAHPGRPVSWLRELLGLTTSGVTRLVDELEREGLLERRPGADARTKAVVVTRRGSTRARQVLRRREEAAEAMLRPLSDDERATLETLVAGLVARLTDDRVDAERLCRMCDRRACHGVPATPDGCPLAHTVPA